MPTNITPVATPTTVTVPNAGEPRTAASVGVPFQASANNTAWEALRFDRSVNEKWFGGLTDPTGNTSQGSTTSYVNWTFGTGGVGTFTLIATETLRISVKAHATKFGNAAPPDDVMVRIRVSSPSQALVTVSETRFSLDSAAGVVYGTVELEGSHVAAFSELYTVQVQIKSTGGTPNWAVPDCWMHLQKVSP